MLTIDELKLLNKSLEGENFEVIGVEPRYGEKHYKLQKIKDVPFYFDEDYLPITDEIIERLKEILPNKEVSIYSDEKIIYFD